jgi:tRNA-dihydrouridine synthase
MTIPIIGSGDIKKAQDAKNAFDRYGVDGVMVARATYGRPWIFREINHYLQTGELLPEPDVRERVRIAKLHFSKSLEYKEGKRAMFEMRRHFSTYFKCLPDFKDTRLKLVTSEDPQEIFSLLDYIGERWGDCKINSQAS